MEENKSSETSAKNVGTKKWTNVPLAKSRSLVHSIPLARNSGISTASNVKNAGNQFCRSMSVKTDFRICQIVQRLMSNRSDWILVKIFKYFVFGINCSLIYPNFLIIRFKNIVKFLQNFKSELTDMFARAKTPRLLKKVSKKSKKQKKQDLPSYKSQLF